MNPGKHNLNEEQLKNLLTRLLLSTNNGSNSSDPNNHAQQQLLQLVLNYTSQVQGNIQNIINSLSSALPSPTRSDISINGCQYNGNSLTSVQEPPIPPLHDLTSLDVDHFLNSLSSPTHNLMNENAPNIFSTESTCLSSLSSDVDGISAQLQATRSMQISSSDCNTSYTRIQSSSTSSDGSSSIPYPLKSVKRVDAYGKSYTSLTSNFPSNQYNIGQHQSSSAASNLLSNNGSISENFSSNVNGNSDSRTLRSLLTEQPSITKKTKLSYSSKNLSNSAILNSDSSEHSSVTCSPASSTCDLPEEDSSIHSFNINKNPSYSSLYNSCSSLASSNYDPPAIVEQSVRKVKSDTGGSRLHRQDLGPLPKSDMRSGHQSPNLSINMSTIQNHFGQDKFRPNSTTCGTAESRLPRVYQEGAVFNKNMPKISDSNPNIKRDSRKYKRSYGSISDSNNDQNSHDSTLVYPVRIPRLPSLSTYYPSALENLALKILRQPEEQHRARYMTEGSRGAIKGRDSEGFPVIQLIGWEESVTLQVFVATESGKVKPNLFYQACRVSGKNCIPCRQRNFDGTNVIELTLESKVNINCIGILKLRNADVEQRTGSHSTKKKSTKARLVFRVNLPHGDGTFTTLQCVSDQILCTQPMGSPEIGRMSLSEGSCLGGMELFIIGRNFTKDIKVIFQEVSDNSENIWEEEAPLATEYFQQTHLVCQVPPFARIDIKSPITVQIILKCDDRVSEPHYFTYLSEIKSKLITESMKSLHLSNKTTPNALTTPVTPNASSTDNEMKWETEVNSSKSQDFFHSSNPHSSTFSSRSSLLTSSNYSCVRPSPRAYYTNAPFYKSEMESVEMSLPTLTASGVTHPRTQECISIPNNAVAQSHKFRYSDISSHSLTESEPSKLSNVSDPKWNKEMDQIIYSASLNMDNSAEFFLPLNSASSTGDTLPNSTNTLTESYEFLPL